MSDADFQDLKNLALSITGEDRQRFTPPADLWSRIEAEAFGTDAANADVTADAAPAEPDVRPRLELAPTIVEGESDSNVIDLDRRDRLAPASVRSRRRWSMVGAAAAAAVVAVFGLSFLGGNPDTTVTHLAQATNEGLPETFGGTADVEAVLAGAQPQLEIDFMGDLPADEPLELWLIKPDLSDMFSLGLVDSDGSYAIPAGVDLDEYSIVDVSVEPDDGDPLHSGRSILRGQLTDAVDA